jgi:SNF2 family DNA or RNA helicase
MSVANRDAAVHKFENNDSIRVLLMSNVGTTGLNLVAASVLVFLVSWIIKT